MAERAEFQKLRLATRPHEHRQPYTMPLLCVGIDRQFLISVGAFAGVPTPLARAFLSIGSAVCGEDFLATGRTLERLGLGDLDRGGLQRLLQDGVTR